MSRSLQTLSAEQTKHRSHRATQFHSTGHIALVVLALLAGAAARPGMATAQSSSFKNDDYLPFTVKIDLNTPLEELLPIPPKDLPPLEPYVGADLAAIPELAFQETPQKIPSSDNGIKSKAQTQIGHTICKINFLNFKSRDLLQPDKKQDGFLAALLDSRVDLQGLGFVMGEECRTKPALHTEFSQVLLAIRGLMNKVNKVSDAPIQQHSKETAAAFWGAFDHAEQRADPKKGKAYRAHVHAVTVAALMQVFGPDSAPMRQGMVKYLAGVPHPEATRALAKLALYSPEPEIHQAAVQALVVRREKDYTDILWQGLSYPWPDVASRAAAALAEAERTDLVTKLVDLLEEPDPRLPRLDKSRGKDAYVAKQLVRLNHHKNCLLCHAPATSDKLTGNEVTAPVPSPSLPLPPFIHYYAHSIPQVSVRVDVTYLRQDFSMLQEVENSDPWPKLQRFDFLVRSAYMDKTQAQEYAAKLKARTAGAPSPYQHAVVSALRSLTGLDVGPNAAAWRKVLK